MTTLRLLAQRFGGVHHAALNYRLPTTRHDLTAKTTAAFWSNNITTPARCHHFTSSIGSGLPMDTNGRWTAAGHHSSLHGFHSRSAFGTKSSPDRAGKSESKAASAAVAENDIFAETSKLGLFAKFKLMYTKYWYVTVPVHCITSCFWFGGFYYLSKSGVDVPSILQYLHISETIIEKFQHSDMGHLAVAYLCYKVATPLRYAVTLGGTTVSIKYLVQAGHIKPMPSKLQLMQMYEQKKADRAAAKAEKDTAEQLSPKDGERDK